ncbi:MAG TPA: hypothetical protein VG758_18390 [Hyphomicrobiaceae bacterium]|jgi:hypothetical protein|nr:hypothetical protein [Hyphomicrobiaceae bacterium]
MRILRRRAVRTDSDAIATHAVLHSHGGLTTVVSAIALLFSAYSLWETSLKQAELSLYVTDGVAYTRDPNNEDGAFQAGGYEVLAVPVTIANGGARDAAVLSLQLDAKNPETGDTARFDAAYTAGGEYFAANRGESSSGRPRTPFTALVVAGRSAWSGTILFYASDYKKPKLISKSNDKIEMTLRVLTPTPNDWLERALGKAAAPVTLTLNVPDTYAGRLGSTVTRLRTTAAGS